MKIYEGRSYNYIVESNIYTFYSFFKGEIQSQKEY